MALNIVTSVQPLNVENIITFIYGDPGTWKTTLGFTAKNPILFDFDEGAYAAGSFRKDSVQIKAWHEVSRFTAQDLDGYDTIIIDTVGRALDMLTEHLAKDSKNVRRGSTNLSMQGYGKLKNEFIAWLKMLRAMKKDIVLLAHSKKGQDDNGNRYYEPDVQGGSLAEVYKVSDMIGYLSIISNNGKEARQLSFTPSNFYYGKDRGQIGNIIVQPMQDAPNQLENIIQATKNHINSLSAEAAKAQQQLENLRNDLLDAETTSDLDELKADLDKSHPLYKEMALSVMSRSKALGFIYDKSSDSFIEPEPVVADDEFEPANEQEVEVANAE